MKINDHMNVMQAVSDLQNEIAGKEDLVKGLTTELKARKSKTNHPLTSAISERVAEFGKTSHHLMKNIKHDLHDLQDKIKAHDKAVGHISARNGHNKDTDIARLDTTYQAALTHVEQDLSKELTAHDAALGQLTQEIKGLMINYLDTTINPFERFNEKKIQHFMDTIAGMGIEDLRILSRILEKSTAQGVTNLVVRAEFSEYLHTMRYPGNIGVTKTLEFLEKAMDMGYTFDQTSQYQRTHIAFAHILNEGFLSNPREMKRYLGEN